MFLIFISFDYYFFIYFYFLRYPKYQKVKIALRIGLQIFLKKYHFKGLYKTTSLNNVQFFSIFPLTLTGA